MGYTVSFQDATRSKARAENATYHTNQLDQRAAFETETMALTWVFALACVAFGVNGNGIQVDQPICDGQQLACSYCLDTVTLLKGTTDDGNTGASIETFMLVICDFINASSPGYKACTAHIKTFPMRLKMLMDAMLSNPQQLCSFVCASRGPVTEKCLSKPVSNADGPLVLTTGDSIACEVCKSVPLLVQQFLTGKGLLDAVIKYLLINCDLLPTGIPRENCIEHTNCLSLKIKLFAAEMNPDTGCKFICSV